MASRRVFLPLYLLSGIVALIYEVAWTRLLTLQIGHTVPAVSTVLAAYMGGLAAGAALGGRYAAARPPDRALRTYGLLELAIGLTAALVPFVLSTLGPMLAWAYRDGDGGGLFPLIRIASGLLVLSIPTMAMGATLPVAARWWVRRAESAGHDAGRLYAINTVGASAGALLSGFVLIPVLGLRVTMAVAVICNLAAACGAFLLARTQHPAPGTQYAGPTRHPTGRSQHPAALTPHPGARPRPSPRALHPAPAPRPVLACTAVTASGFSALLYEVAWTRILALMVGPTTYAFSAMLASFIGGIGLGSLAGSRIARRSRQPAFWLAIALATTGLGALAASSFIGNAPLLVGRAIASPDARFGSTVLMQTVTVFLLLLPSTMALGAAFPLAVAATVRDVNQVSIDVGTVYGANTLGAIAGSLAGGFLLVPIVGLQNTLLTASLIVSAAALLVLLAGVRSIGARLAGSVLLALSLILAIGLPTWDHELVASGAYKYAPYIRAPDLESALAAGTLLYYREGASGTVSVRHLTGATSMSIDGKVDASNGGDMLTQKLLAHLPLLMHAAPKRVAIVGLGSGVTVGAALRHPIERADVLEISPEVVEAASFFATENHNALRDPRTRLIVGDGRSHLLLSAARYDVIISEPSNPWMAGVAALFTREFFQAASTRLNDAGLFCQWAHTYDMRNEDLRSIAATFASVFPHVAVWLVGDSDLLMIGSGSPVGGRLDRLESHWARPGVASDLAEVAVRGPFNLWASYLWNEDGLRRYGGQAVVQSDDRMALEFSAPRALIGASGTDNRAALLALARTMPPPEVIRTAMQHATAAEWAAQGWMALKAEAPEAAYDAFWRAAGLDPRSAGALDGLLKAATPARQLATLRGKLEELRQRDPTNLPARIALSRLLAATGNARQAASIARDAVEMAPDDRAALEQLGSVYADADDMVGLKPVVARLQRLHPAGAETAYLAATVAYSEDRLADAIALAQQTVQRDPAHARGHNLLGAAHATLGQADQARASFAASLRANPADPSTYANAGQFELTRGDPDGAVDYFAEALTLDPTFGPALAGLADALERLGQPSRAARVRLALRPPRTAQ